jgi:hypothetical protein
MLPAPASLVKRSARREGFKAARESFTLSLLKMTDEGHAV